MTNLSDFLTKIDYQFKNQAFLEEALTHPSLSKKSNTPNYQRLEFLGDTVLSMVIAVALMKNYSTENEGQLSKRHAYLVSGSMLANIALKIDLGKIMKMSKSEETRDGKSNKRNLENTLEALIGAIYLDSGLTNSQKFITKYWHDLIDEDEAPPQDPVSCLQEIVQAKTKKLPKYQVNRNGGDEHKPIFTAIVEVNRIKYAANGYSKKEAQKNAAKCALEMIGKN